jgi:predicted dehydrogenase
MYNIAIIGAGQLGSRHLQGLKLADLEMNIFVMDINEQSLLTAKERYDQAPNNEKFNKLQLCNSISGLPKELDLAIIATGSLMRAAVTEELLKSTIVRNIIFEKVLFPAIHQYSEIQRLLSANKINSWVNCARRMFEHCKMLKGIFDGSKFDLTVKGENWGLGCNTIHYLDLFAFLTGSDEFSVSLDLDKEILHSKRAGYIEFTGTVRGNNAVGASFSISSFKQYDRPVTVTISNSSNSILLEESAGKMSVNGVCSEIVVPFQSQLTGRLAEAILLQGACELATFEESVKLHLRFLKPLIDFYNSITGNNEDNCPIT